MTHELPRYFDEDGPTMKCLTELYQTKPYWSVPSIPDVPPKGFFGDIQDFEVYIRSRPAYIMFDVRTCSHCPIASYMIARHRRLNIFVNSQFTRTIRPTKEYPNPGWMFKLIMQFDRGDKPISRNEVLLVLKSLT